MDFLEVKSRKRKRRISDNRTQLPSNIQIVIKNLFEKKFKYEKIEDYTLKGSFDGKLCEVWKIQDYIVMKNELNTLKNELNDKDMITWHEHTRFVNLAGNIALEIRNQLRPELCTQAWCKFYEIASTYLNITDKESLVTVHLCEAPGAFVTSLNHFLYTHGYSGKWMWLATTLNPYYEGNNIGQMIDEDIFIRSSYGNWYFGEDNTGNLMSATSLKGLQEKLSNVKVDLVTADGSIDCQGDPAEQENVVSRLQHCEVLTALHILSPGGTLVVKMFTLFECKAVSLMYLLNCVFEKVEVFKPCTSKGGNSEVYVIGLVFKGRQCCERFLQNVTPAYFGDTEPTGCLFSLEDIPASFLEQHRTCVQFFKDCQMSTIQRNLDLLKVMTDDERSKVEEQKDFCMECFFNRYDIKPMQYAARLMKIPKRRKQTYSRNTEFSTKAKLEGKFTGSFCERQELSTLPWRQKIDKIETYEDEVNREDNSLWIQCQHESISDEDVEMYQILKERRVDSIQSSRFCHGFYLHRTHELIQNSKWLAEQTEVDSEFVTNIALKLKTLLSDTIRYYNDRPSQDHFVRDMHLQESDHYGNNTVNGDQSEPVNLGKSKLEVDEINVDTDVDHVIKGVGDHVDLAVNSEGNEHGCMESIDTGQINVIDRRAGEEVIPKANVGNENNNSDNAGFGGHIEDHNCEGCEVSGSKDGTGKVDNTCQVDDLEHRDKVAGASCETMDLKACINGCKEEHLGNKGDFTCGRSSFRTDNGAVGDREIGMGGDAFTCSYIKGDSPILKELSKQGCNGGVMVRLYSLGSRKICQRFELLEQKELLVVVQDILKNCKTSDYVVIEMGTCLSRFTAGLVYILYRTFKEVGFEHHHGNLMRRHLVCINYQPCPMKLRQFVEEVCHMIEPGQSESVLEVVPVLTILEDEDFTSFLRISNVNLLQSFITTVVNAEKKQLCLDNT